MLWSNHAELKYVMVKSRWTKVCYGQIPLNYSMLGSNHAKLKYVMVKSRWTKVCYGQIKLK